MYSNTIQPGGTAPAPAFKKKAHSIVMMPIATPLDHQSGSSHPPPPIITASAASTASASATINMITLPPTDIFSTPGRIVMPETPRRGDDNNDNNGNSTNGTQRRLFFSPVKFSPVKPQKDIPSLGTSSSGGGGGGSGSGDYDDKKRKRGDDMLDKLFRGIGSSSSSSTETALHNTKLAAANTTPAPTMKSRATIISMKASTTPKPTHQQPKDKTSGTGSGTATTPWRIKIGDFGTTPTPLSVSVAPRQQQTSTTRRVAANTCTPASMNSIQLAPPSSYSLQQHSRSTRRSSTIPGSGSGIAAGHDYWMCAECSTGVPSLAKPCQQCKRGVSPVPLPRGATTTKEGLCLSVSPPPPSITTADAATRSVTLSAAVSSAAAAAASYAASAPIMATTPSVAAASAAAVLTSSPKRVVPASAVAPYAPTTTTTSYASPARRTPASFASPARVSTSGLRLTPAASAGGGVVSSNNNNLSYSFCSPRRSPRFYNSLSGSGPSPRLTALSHASDFDFGDLASHDFLGMESSGSNHIIAGTTLDWTELPGVDEDDGVSSRADEAVHKKKKKGQEGERNEKSEEGVGAIAASGSTNAGEDEEEQAAVAFLASSATSTCKSPVVTAGTQQQGKQLKSILKQKRREDKKAKRAAEEAEAAAAAVAEGDTAEVVDSEDEEYVPGGASVPPRKKRRKKKTTKSSTNTSSSSSSSSSSSNIADSSTFTLYDPSDVQHINAVHSIVRRDIWEGFVVGRGENKLEKSEDNQRKFGRLTRYEGTIGFRCRFCKNAPVLDRADKACVYPRTLERIYLANIRFQRDHVE